MVNNELIGVRHFKSSKNGKEFYILLVAKEFSSRESGNGCIGRNMEEIWVPEDLYDKVSVLQIGKPVKFSYEINGRNAYVTDFEVGK